MLETLLTLLAHALSGDFGAILLATPFVIAPLALACTFGSLCWDYDYRLRRRVFQLPEWDVLAMAVLVLAGMGWALYAILANVHAYGL